MITSIFNMHNDIYKLIKAKMMGTDEQLFLIHLEAQFRYRFPRLWDRWEQNQVLW